VIVTQKLKILFILKSILDVEGKGKIGKDVFLHLLVIVAHSIEKSFFITKNVVVNEMIMDSSLFYLSYPHCLPVL
jgi:hypothetical protein